MAGLGAQRQADEHNAHAPWTRKTTGFLIPYKFKNHHYFVFLFSFFLKEEV